MDSMLDKESDIVKGPGLLELQQSLVRKWLHEPRQEAFLVQAVKFVTAKHDVYVLIDRLERPNWDDEPWKFEGRVIQIDNERCSYHFPCNGEFTVKTRKGEIEIVDDQVKSLEAL